MCSSRDGHSHVSTGERRRLTCQSAISSCTAVRCTKDSGYDAYSDSCDRGPRDGWTETGLMAVVLSLRCGETAGPNGTIGGNRTCDRVQGERKCFFLRYRLTTPASTERRAVHDDEGPSHHQDLSFPALPVHFPRGCGGSSPFDPASALVLHARGRSGRLGE